MPYGATILRDILGDPIYDAEGEYIYLWNTPGFCERVGDDEDICNLSDRTEDS